MSCLHIGDNMAGFESVPNTIMKSVLFAELPHDDN